jgi:hypothetical protein
MVGMAIELLRIAAEQGLIVAGTVGVASVPPGWQVTCQRCTGRLELPALPAPRPGARASGASASGMAPVWWVRRICAFATRHRHRRRVLGGAVVRAAR